VVVLVNTRLVNTRAGRYVVLAFTDTEQPAREIVRFYQLRFQIELIFRDAKQLAGLCHCQARSQEKIDFHLNMSLAAVYVARLEILLYRQVESMNSLRAQSLQRASGPSTANTPISCELMQASISD